MRSIFKKSSQFILILAVSIGWIFSGWPQVFNFPPGIQKALATPVADFNIQRRCETPAGGIGTVTLTAGTDYTAPADDTKAFIRMVSTRLSGMGDTSGGGTQEADDFTWYLSDPDFAGGSVVFTRTGTTNPQRFCWEIIEYVGSSGGANEIAVLDVGTAAYTTTGLMVDGASVTVTDDNDVVVFITGQDSVEVTTQTLSAGLNTSEWVSASDIPRFTRGLHDSDANHISYAVVEFTGSNWAVERIQHNFTLAGTTETETITDVGSLTRAFAHAQYRSGTNNLDEYGAEMWLSATNQASFLLQSGATTPSDKYGVIWVVRNSDTVSGTAMNVQHLSGSRASAGVSEGAANEEDEWTVTITTVGDTAQTSIMGESDRSSGTGNATPRGWISFYLNSTTGVKLYQSDDGQTITYRFQVVEWPQSEPPPVYSVSITSSGVIEYGFVELSTASSTVGNGYTQTAENDGNTTEQLNVKSSDASGGTTWTLASAIGSNIFKHEFSTTTGSVWTVMPDSATYVTAKPSVVVSGTVDFDFRLTTPSVSADYQQKSITITVQAVAP